MAADPSIVSYVKNQLTSGFSAQEIRSELARQGWDPHEVEQAFSEARQQVIPPVVVPHRSKSYLLALVGGMIIFVFGLETTLSLPLISSLLADVGIALQLLGLISTWLVDPLWVGALALVFGLVVIVGSLMVTRAQKSGGILAIIFAVLAIVGFHGLLPLIGGLLGLIGGALSLRAGSPPVPALPSPAPHEQTTPPPGSSDHGKPW